MERAGEGRGEKGKTLDPSSWRKGGAMGWLREEQNGVGSQESNLGQVEVASRWAREEV